MLIIDDAIFKNKAYGAYVLRKNYYRNTAISLITSIVIVVLIFSFPLFIQLKKQWHVEHTHLRPTQVPMELLDIPIEALNGEKEKLAEQKAQEPPTSPPPAQTTPEPSLALADSAQNPPPDTTLNRTSKQESEMEEEGIFECGTNLLNFRMWFMQNFQFPTNNGIRKTEGRAIAVFIVNEQGYVDSVNIVSGIDPIIDSAIKQTLLKSPRWKPCTINGKKVKQLYQFPIYLVRKI
jgi:protein TonB